ncbi:MAG: glycine/betaine/sarcosine/D-proline family reductase selenoprotein B [Myxococcaceae bacterium]|nr:glycine/betaine/sarcosine/D-proline family reductase selenoprotein B [Myxococcaceae bacterium]MCI0669974.1 glycine/betaine/sarcosine/D-proline family reductase selenoprotein B [Myxococcaceae bacterium]
MEKPLELSRYCIPFTPFRKRLEESTFCLVTTAAVRHRADTPFQLEGDSTFRVIRSESTTADLTYDDAHYDHGCVEKDLNCVFPIDRMTELAREGRIGGLTENHFSFGFSQALRELREKTIPGMVREVDRTRPDAVLLTGG